MIILARELTPYDFGLLSITEVVLILISAFGTTGVPEYLLAYQGDDIEEIMQSTFWFILSISFIIIALVLFLAPYWAVSNNDTRIIPIVFILSGIFLCTQLQIIPKAIYSRKLDFVGLVKIQTPFIILIPLLKVVAALNGLGVYSLILPTLILRPIETLILYSKIRWKFSLNLLIYRWKEIFSFTKNLIGSTILSRLSSEGDKIILSKFLGLAELGVYNLAFQFSNIITSNLTSITNNILSSVLPKYREDIDLMRLHYFGFLKVIAFFVFPILAIMGMVATPLIEIVYSSKWVDSILPFQILILYAIIRSVTTSFGSVMNTLHLPHIGFTVTFWYTPCHLIASIIGAQYGIVGLAIGVVVVKYIFVYIGLIYETKALNTTVKNYLQNLQGVFFILLLSAISSFASILILGNILYGNNWVYLIVVSGIFSITYLTLFRLIQVRELVIISGFLEKSISKLGTLFKRIFFLPKHNRV